MDSFVLGFFYPAISMSSLEMSLTDEEFLRLLAEFCDLDKPEKERHALMEELRPEFHRRIEKSVQSCARSYSRRLSEDADGLTVLSIDGQFASEFQVEDITVDLSEHLMKKILEGRAVPSCERREPYKFDEVRNFQGFCKKCVSNKACGIYRKIMRRTNLMNENRGKFQQQSPHKQPPISFEEGKIREEMDAFILWYNKTVKRPVNHFPSIIWIRLRVVVQALKTSEDCNTAEKYIDWNAEEKLWRFKSRWPTILEIWQRICADREKRIRANRVKNPAPAKSEVESQDIVDAINSILEELGWFPLTYEGYWNVQVNRAKGKMKKCSIPIPIMSYLMDL